MAAVAKGCMAILSKTVLRSFVSNSFLLKSSPKLCFHHSALLYVAGQEIRMPSLSPTMTEGTIVKWLKNEGDPVAPGDVLCEIQTDKAVMSFETEEEGILAKILLPDDSKDIKVGTLIALMVAEGEDWKDVEIPSGAGAAPTSPTDSSSGTPAAMSAPPSKPSATSGGRGAGKIGPAVRTLLEAYQLSPGEVKGSGPHGIVIKADILQFVRERGLKQKPPKEVSLPSVGKAGAVASKTPSAPSPVFKDEGHSDIELSNMRKTIAKRLTESKTTIPHSYGTVESTIDKVLMLRKSLKADGIAVSVNDFVIKAVAAALQRVPAMNAHYVGDRTVVQPSIDVSVAVATPAGLITPIVVGADGLGLEDISSKVRELASRAREGRLQPHEFMGGSFTISNLGMFGISEFSAIINPPQIAILAVGGGRAELDGEGKPVTKMSATLSYDGRAVDEATAAEFLEAVREYLEDPEVLLLGGLGLGQKIEAT